MDEKVLQWPLSWSAVWVGTRRDRAAAGGW
jgi:hypothetical protein